MIKKGDKLIIMAEALEDENSAYVATLNGSMNPQDVKNVVESVKNGQILDDSVTLAKQNTGMSWKEKLSQITRR